MHLAKCLFLEAFNTVEFPFLLFARSSKRTSIILILHKISKYGTHMCPLTENVVKDFFKRIIGENLCLIKHQILDVTIELVNC